MRYFTLLLICFLLNACSSEKTVSQKSFSPESYTIEQFYNNTRVTGGTFNHDASKILLSSNETGIYNVKSIALGDLKENVLTTSGDESIFAESFFPNDDRFLFSADKGGNEIDHIYMQDTNGAVKELTTGEKEKAGFRRWRKNLKEFYYSSNGRNPSAFDILKMDIENFTPELFYQNDDGRDLALISDDEMYLVLIESVTTSSNNMFLVNKTNGNEIQLNKDGAGISHSPQYFSQDGKSFYYLTDEGKEFTYLVKYNLADGTTEQVYGADWDIWYAYESWNGKYRVIGINDDAKTVVKLFDAKSGNELKFPDVEGKSVSSVSFSRDESKMRMVAASTTSTSDIYVYNFDSKDLKRITNTLNEQLKEDQLVEGQIVRFPSFDGLEIPATFYKPHQASADNKVPALVLVHGGPGGQTRLNFNEMVQYLVNQGYVVLGVNNRGSSGYGKTFYKMDDQNHGDKDLKDCIWAKKYMQGLDYVDADKIGIIGGSYGGYMVMAALTFAPEEFDVGVNIFGVTNWLRTLKSIPPWWGSFKDALYKEMGDPNTADSVRLHNISPLFHTEKVTKPLMVLQGANDPRVLQVESDEIVAGVKKNGVPVEYVLFPDEGHGFVKKENQIKAYGEVNAFLEKYLKGKTLD